LSNSSFSLSCNGYSVLLGLTSSWSASFRYSGCHFYDVIGCVTFGDQVIDEVEAVEAKCRLVSVIALGLPRLAAIRPPADIIGAAEALYRYRRMTHVGVARVKQMIVPDEHDSHGCLQAARSPKLTVAKLLHASWQRCRVHFMRNLLAHAGRQGRRGVAAFIGTAFAQDDAGARPTISGEPTRPDDPSAPLWEARARKALM
jgi:hypothetical protein